MGASMLHLLVQLTLVSSAAVLVVGALRRPLRFAVGARAAYLLWIAVPAAALALLLPTRSAIAPAPADSLLPGLSGGVASVLGAAGEAGADHSPIVLTAWLAGVLSLAAWLAIRQRRFVRSLGPMVVSPDGVHRSERLVAPMLLGGWRPRVVVPADFEARYAEQECRLMLAHERAHQERGDAWVNLLAAAWLCLCWFNPLMYWALARLRFDQELACDALVVSRARAGRKRYARALLKMQMISESAWRVPVGCHWHSSHPLKERISMLKLNPPALPRRIAGVAFTMLLAASGMYLVSSSFAQSSAQASDVESTDKKFSFNAKDADVREVLKRIAEKGAHNVLVGDQVSGTITLELENVTWREALNAVVQSQGLVTRESGNIVIVDVSR